MHEFRQIIGTENKIPFNHKYHTFSMSSFNWAFGFTDDKGILSMESACIRCKDHLIDCLNTKTCTGLQYCDETPHDTPITLLLILSTTSKLEDIQSSITRMLNPLEVKHKWKKTTVEYVDQYKATCHYGMTHHFKLYKVTASKMWKRNGFLFSIWASLLRLGYFGQNLTHDTFITTITKSTIALTGCNEFEYIKWNQSIPHYKERWDFVLNNLHLFKTSSAKKSIHIDKRYAGHGTDGIFYCFNRFMDHPAADNTGFAQSHPFYKIFTTDYVCPTT
jgi:hypothetical protein